MIERASLFCEALFVITYAGAKQVFQTFDDSFLLF